MIKRQKKPAKFGRLFLHFSVSRQRLIGVGRLIIDPLLESIESAVISFSVDSSVEGNIFGGHSSQKRLKVKSNATTRCEESSSVR